MANVKISALPSLSSVSDSVIIPVVDSSTTQRVTAAAVRTYVLASQLQSDWNQSTSSNIAYIKNKPDLSGYATVTNLQTLDANIGAFETYANASFITSSALSPYATTASLSSYATTASLQTLSANVGAFETYANATFGTSSYGNLQMLANLASTNTVTFGGSVVLGTNNKALGFKTTNGSNVTLIQQNDDNFVFYSTDASSSQRPIWSVYANSSTSSFSISAPVTVKDVRDTVYDLGTTGGTIAPNGANGDVQTITCNAAITINGFTSPVSGQTITLIINQGTGGFALTSNMKFAGGYKTLSTAANATDILHISYIGSTYYASLVTGYV